MAGAAIAAALLLAAVAPAGAAVQPLNGTYKGVTSQVNSEGVHAPVVLKVGAHGTKLRVAEVWWLTMCPDAPGEYAEKPLIQATQFSGAPIVRGRFGGTSTYISTGGGNLEAGYAATIRITFRGKFVSWRRAKGTLSLSASVTDPSGQHFADCETSGVRWTATRG